jgi:site-specific recombinase XerD
MNMTANIESDRIEPIMRALRQLSPSGQGAVAALVRQLADREGVSVEQTGTLGLRSPTEGIPLWLAKLKAERYSARTVHMYRYLARRYLDRHPAPTKLEVQSYLAKRLEEVSPALVSNERKALASLFGFLHSEGLWPTNPLNGVGHVRVRYRERLCPEIGDVLKVMETDCSRRKDTDKLRMLVLLLATTGLRISEAAGILRRDIDLDALELRVTGKGDKTRVVPLLPLTAKALRDYVERRGSGSPYLFPGNTKTGHMEAHNPEKTLRRACLRAGVTPFTPHQLRHLYATHMLRGGAKLEVVARILGHASVGVTADIYRHVATAELHEEHARFAPLNGGNLLGAGGQGAAV